MARVGPGCRLGGQDRTIDDDPALGELNVPRWQRFSYLILVRQPPPATNDGTIPTLEPDLNPIVTHKSPDADVSHLNITPIYPNASFARLGRGWRTLFRSRICQ